MSGNLTYDESKSGSINLRAPGGHMNASYTYFGTDSNGVDYYSHNGDLYTKNGITACYYRENGSVVETDDVPVYNSSGVQVNSSYVDSNVYVTYDESKSGSVNLRAPGGHMNANYTYVGTDSNGVDYYEHDGDIYTKNGITACYYRDGDGVVSSDQIVVTGNENTTEVLDENSNPINVPTLTKNPDIDSMVPLRNQTLPGREDTEVMTYKGSADGYDYYADSVGNVYRKPIGGGDWEDCGCKSNTLTINEAETTTEEPAPEEEKVPYEDFDFTFACDSQMIDDNLKFNMKTAADDIESLIELIYEKIHGMPDAKIWSGNSYEAFRDSVDGYKKNLDDLVVVLRAFKKLFGDAQTEAEELGTTIDSEINSVS